MIDRIYCRNFRRLLEADIRLDDGITVLIGNNGTGKSTIIEAAIFNLFGKVRAGTKKETVRRTGAKDEDITATVVDFTLSSGTENETHYRCKRWYTKKMSVMASLISYTPAEYELIANNEDPFDTSKDVGTEIASSASGVTSAVADLLGISYDGFMASFVAQQKELNSLSSLTQENRKKFFLDLLGYSRLDDIKPEISKKLRGVEQAIDIIERQNMSVAEIEKKLSASTKEKEKLDTRSDNGKKKLAEAKEKRDSLYAECEQLASVAQKVKEYMASGIEQKEERDKLVEENESLSSSIERDETIAHGYDENSSIASKLDEARNELALMKELRKTSEERERLIGGLTTRKNELQEAKQQAEILSERTKDEPDLDSAQASLANAMALSASMDTEFHSAETTMNEYSSLLSAVDSGDVAKCPTCGTDVSDAKGRKHLEEELTQATSAFKSAKKSKEQADEAKAEAQRKVVEVQSLVRTYKSDLMNLKKYEQKISFMEQTISDTQNQVDSLTHKLDTDKPVPSVSDIHSQELAVASLAKELERETEIKTAYYRLKQNKKIYAMNAERISKINAELVEKREYCKKNHQIEQKYEKQRAQRDKASETYDKYAEALNRIESDRGAASASISALEGNLEIAKAQSEQLIGLKDNVESLNGAKQVIDFLRKNLPSRIAPRLAEEASRLLDIATAGAYTMLEIDETYEVFVYTDNEIRPISQMSGGETDVISLCIRIAISKMILEATGITEQTLILDEIFGALDDSRRENTCQVLRNIGTQLKKILCITHIDEIKDMADKVYIVEMDENGVSHVREQINASVNWNNIMKSA